MVGLSDLLFTENHIHDFWSRGRMNTVDDLTGRGVVFNLIILDGND